MALNYPEAVLREGDSNPDLIMILKQKLNYHGWEPPLDIKNPFFRDTTEKAVKWFQKTKLLTQDGIVGPLTWHRLFNERIPVVYQATDLIGRVKERLLNQLYVREKSGKNDGPEVEAFLKSVGLGKGFAWCVALIYWAFQEEAKILGVKNPMRRTAGVLDLWNNTPDEFRIHVKDIGPNNLPQAGDILVMKFSTTTGHLAFIKIGGMLKAPTIEGNTSADPTLASEDRDGQGVYERFRDVKGAKVLGIIRYFH